MKLLLCLDCGEIFSLSLKEKSCSCGKTKGQYTDKVNAWYSGNKAIPLGISNSSLFGALSKRKEINFGNVFNSWIISEPCITFQRRK